LGGPPNWTGSYGAKPRPSLNREGWAYGQITFTTGDVTVGLPASEQVAVME